VTRAHRAAVLALFAAVGAAAASASGADDLPMPRRRAPSKLIGVKRAPPVPDSAAAADATHCAACHVAEGWQQVRFNHDRTGFPLRGGHTSVTCGGCHPRGFDVPVADSCAGCHRDRHAGEFGTQCEGCHEDRSWRPLFQADAHRRTAFPLVGKHGLIPCQQCHGNMRDRAFVGAPVACASCHQADYDRTRTSGVDHVAAGFSRDCQTCHSTWRFWPARVVAHEPCFYLLSGAHHGIRCLGCHTSLPTIMFTSMCTSGVGTATCTSCHEHNCAKSDAQHANIDPVLRASYQCTDGSCLTCHQKGTL
jgi:hypothetical protein